MLRLALLSVLAVSAAAQSPCLEFPSSVPQDPLAWTTAPLGATDSQVRRTMILLSSLAFANVPRRIDEIAFLPRGNGLRRCDELIVRMSHTNVAVLDRVFDNNVTETPVEVLRANDHVFPGVAGQLMRVGLQRGFDYVPAQGNLLVEIVVRGLTIDGVTIYQGFSSAVGAVAGTMISVKDRTLPLIGLPSAFAQLVLCAGAGRLGWFGDGCAGSGGAVPALGLGGSPALGGTTDVWVSNARPTAPVQLVLGTDNAPPLPQDLTSVGMPGCHLYVAPLDAIGGTTDPAGLLRVPLRVPNRAELVGAILYTQAFIVDPGANGAGLAATNYGRLLIGR